MSEFVSGLADASKALERLGQRVGAKALVSAVKRATTPVVKQMRAAAPRGTSAHKTYKGRLVAPGYAARSIKSSARFNKATGTAVATIGVAPEAFYLVQFYDSRPGKTPYTISSRRIKGRGRKQIKPYTLKAKPWFSSVFINSENEMLSRFKQILLQNIEKASNGN